MRTLNGHVVRLAALCGAICVCSERASAVNVEIYYQSLNTSYHEQVFGGEVNFWRADETADFEGEGENEDCNFQFWIVDGSIIPERGLDIEALVGTGVYTKITATAWYWCTAPCPPPCPEVPPRITVRAIDLVSGNEIVSSSDGVVVATSPSEFNSGCGSTPCTIDIQSGSGEGDLTEIEALPTLPPPGSSSRVFRQWFFNGQLLPVGERTLGVGNGGVAIAIYESEELTIPRIGEGLIDLDFHKERQIIPEICFVIGGIDGCPWCDGAAYCWFQFENVDGYDVILVDDGMKEIGQRYDIGKGIQRIRLSAIDVRKAGGMQNVGAVFQRNGSLAIKDVRRVRVSVSRRGVGATRRELP